MFPPDIHDLARKLVDSFKAKNMKVATAESCTGGLIAAALTEIPGSSSVLERGFITYSNEAKSEQLGIPAGLIEAQGAVSAEVAEAMAQGALQHSRADVAVAVTGIAGPSGGTPVKPVGLVYIGLATRDGMVFHYKCGFKGDREEIRLQSVKEAFQLVISLHE